MVKVKLTRQEAAAVMRALLAADRYGSPDEAPLTAAINKIGAAQEKGSR